MFEDSDASAALRLVGFPPAVQKAHDFVMQKLSQAEAQTDPVEIKLHPGETFEEAVANFEDFVARRGLVKLLVQIQEPKLVLPHGFNQQFLVCSIEPPFEGTQLLVLCVFSLKLHRGY